MPSPAQWLGIFEHEANADHRYASFDYCFNYFHSFPDKRDIANDEHMETSCMQLGAYLASWGMLRGGGFLLQTKSMRHFRGVIGVIASEEMLPVWEIDCDGYHDANIARLRNAYSAIRHVVIPAAQTELTLVTKIMLGTFACVPAFDERFTDTMRSYGTAQGWNCRFRRFNNDALRCIAEFYERHNEVIDAWSQQRHTFDFMSGQMLPTNVNYTKAKIVDMIGFQANGGEVVP